LKVPRDLSVIGVDGHDFAYLFDLTTISQPVRDQGRIAARLLLEQVNSTQTGPASVVSVGSGLIRRGTTGPWSSIDRSPAPKGGLDVLGGDPKAQAKRARRKLATAANGASETAAGGLGPTDQDTVTPN